MSLEPQRRTKKWRQASDTKNSMNLLFIFRTEARICLSYFDTSAGSGRGRRVFVPCRPRYPEDGTSACRFALQTRRNSFYAFRRKTRVRHVRETNVTTFETKMSVYKFSFLKLTNFGPEAVDQFSAL